MSELIGIMVSKTGIRLTILSESIKSFVPQYEY
jgi:hypothetical protein